MAFISSRLPLVRNVGSDWFQVTNSVGMVGGQVQQGPGPSPGLAGVTLSDPSDQDRINNLVGLVLIYESLSVPRIKKCMRK